MSKSLIKHIRDELAFNKGSLTSVSAEFGLTTAWLGDRAGQYWRPLRSLPELSLPAALHLQEGKELPLTETVGLHSNIDLSTNI